MTKEQIELKKELIKQISDLIDESVIRIDNVIPTQEKINDIISHLEDTAEGYKIDLKEYKEYNFNANALITEGTIKGLAFAIDILKTW